jgi:3-hydroxyisobutyrate dehydrogenase-like beta-hydroxyacid dehydrogenase
MGSAVARALIAGGWTVCSHLEGRSAASHSAAEAAGIRPLGSLAEVLETVNLVISLVPPAAAEEVARAVAAAARDKGRRPLYVDLNSVAPATVKSVADALAASGLECADGAFVGSAADLGGRTRLYLSGPRVDELVETLPEALHATQLGLEVGAASAFKLAFAGFNKGLVALFLEVMGAAEATGKPEELLACLRAFYPGTIETLERLLPSYPKHAARRADELDELAQWLASEGHDPACAEAARDVLSRYAALGLDGERRWTFTEALAAWFPSAPS